MIDEKLIEEKAKHWFICEDDKLQRSEYAKYTDCDEWLLKKGYIAGFRACEEMMSEENRKLRFMIDNGLDWKDMHSDGAQGEGIDR